MSALLSPGLHRADAVADDVALIESMLRVEVAWVAAQAALGKISQDDVDAVARAAQMWRPDLGELQLATEAAGNPVAPLVDGLREAAGHRLAPIVHRGLTSQDVLDTALVLLSRAALRRTRADLGVTVQALRALAEKHRTTVMAGRTLTQHAVPITFGLKAAQWLAGVLDSVDVVDGAIGRLPVQCGGAAGTLSLAAETVDPLGAARAFAAQLQLVWPGVPWHTNRAPVTAIGHALVSVTDALGVIATNIALLARPEFGEVREGRVAGRGGSSTMPHKNNPVLAVLVRSAAMQAPHLLAQLHADAAQAVDERPDGAWHSEWPALARLLELTVVAASQSAELVSHVEIDADAMAARVDAAAAQLLAESGTAVDPRGYLGAACAFVDAVLDRAAGLADGRGA
jgi:3-carboxy-cis,cis-muconate cycloisomerase